MDWKRLIVFLFILLLTLSGCKKNEEINILSDEKYLLLPFYIEKTYGKLQIENTPINLFSTSNSANFIKLLNLSKYNVIITDNITFDFIKSNDHSWIKICEIAVKKPAVYKLVRNKTEKFNDKTYALNTPLYRKFADKNTIFIDTTDELFTKNKIYFKKIKKGFIPVEKIGRVKYYLCVRENSVAFKSKNLKNLLILYKDGLIYTKDPAVVKYVTQTSNIKTLKEIDFINCI
ncbi:hypothetical protein [Desulfurobacterium atlanticum]|uniref:Uncharacterized protein n=1 Tax=Desulfurobacterium atlanticum TaxID=240169 RepID=A0A238YPC0_9BACT|nr:hypothetical protein [Desulfurobacterium atlanticum]SNR72443.1 hypothetical protein SAMN06265340_10446 [Desulfurobacterium atlanticum]